MPRTQETEKATMKSRFLTIISLLALCVALTAAATASAESSPAQDVYNPTGQVLDVVQSGDNDTAPENGVKDNTESGQSPEVCSTANGKDANGNAVTYGSKADCAENATAPATPTAPTKASTGQLPFTGFQAGLVALAGAALLGGGFAMRRVANRDAD